MEDIIGDQDPINCEAVQPRVTPALSSAHLNPQLENVADPVTTDNPESDTQSLNEEISPLAVLASLADSCSDDPSLTIPKPENVENPPEPARPVTRSSMGIFKPNLKYALTVAASDILVPRSTKFALTILEWKHAMDNEIAALHKNDTWIHILRRRTIMLVLQSGSSK